MAFRSLVLVTSILFSLSAFAQGDAAPASESTASYSDSEYLHQAPGGKFELTPAIHLNGETTEFKNTTTKENFAQFMIGVEGEYGFTDMFSLSATLATGVGRVSYSDCPVNTTCPDSTKQDGLDDPSLGANFRFPVGMGVIRAGGDLSFSIEDSKVKSNGDTNNASGGVTVKPYVGYEITLGRSILGAAATYDLYQGDRTLVSESTTSSTKSKIKDARRSAISVFYEFNFPRIVSLGGALEYTRRSDSKTELAGVTTKNNDGLSTLGLNVYVPLKFNETVTLIPSFTAGSVDDDSSAVIDSHTYVSLNCAGRFTF